MLTIPGVGLLTATALVAATGGSVAHFKDARHFASWFGLTPKEYSSGSYRRPPHLQARRQVSAHAVYPRRPRAVIRAATVSQRPAGRSIRCGQWALAVAPAPTHEESHLRTAIGAARICFATLRDQRPTAPHPPWKNYKSERQFHDVQRLS
ncbi:MAG: transposase [Steroidobacteraceae bacterium]